MVRPLTISMMIAMPLASALLGLQLGRATIAEIDPVHFREAETRFHSDLVANRPAIWAGGSPVRLSDASLTQGLGSGCIKCIDYPEEYQPIHDRSSDVFDPVVAEPEVWTETAAHTPTEAAGPLVAEDLAEETETSRSDVARYAYYVITEDGEQRARTDGRLESPRSIEAVPASADANRGVR
ncbi:hypothetical protein [Sphingosinicella rhizophila]|uniref:Uncharacterized protein n=1 Tax=Sphingosinicella rhizophila TaxID=3050082 RepID=A0ABU3Q2T1_9SPHN|nr:hypothetical protein [Sphingosinicella sp. GR2756]MDT9597698.1 hypothetical protein [Sphingosinicella sp. GR2756]